MIKEDWVELKEIIESLHEMGAHFVLAKKSKRPISSNWQKTKPKLNQVLNHIEKDELVGIMPVSLQCLVIDIDEGDPNTFTERYGMPLLQYSTQRKGGEHLWYLLDKDESHGNKEIYLKEIDMKGDLRCANGYVIFWSDINDWARLHYQLLCYMETEGQHRLSPGFWFDLHGDSKKPWSAGNRNNTLNEELWKAKKNGASDKILQCIIDKAKSSGLPPKEIKDTLKSVEKSTEEQKIRHQLASLERAPLIDYFENVRGYKSRYNELSGYFEIHKGEEWEHVDKKMMNVIRQDVRDNCSIAKETKDGMSYLPAKHSEVDWNQFFENWFYTNSVNPFLEYMKKCEEKIQNISRKNSEENFRKNFWKLETWLPNVLGAERNKLNQWVSASILIALATRQINPGEKYDLMPILISEQQGIGKSTALRELLPEDLQRYFTDDFTLAMDHKEWREAISGSAVVEIGELVGLSRKEVSATKAFISRQVDKGRDAYGRSVEMRPRRCIMVGTINLIHGQKFLREDPSGQRRFIPVECGITHTLGSADKVVAKMSELRDHLWGVAYHIAKDPHARKEYLYLSTSTLSHDHTSRVNEYEEHNSLFETEVLQILERMEKDEKSIRMEDILTTLKENGMPHGTYEQWKAVPVAMKRLGYISKNQRVDGRQTKVWVKAEE